MKAYVVEKEALSHNIELLQKMANGVPIWAVLKGNGYGIGVLPLARHLAEAGIDHFCVTEVREAELLRENGFDTAQILMLRSVENAEEINRLIDLRAILTVGSPQMAALVNEIAAQRADVAEVHVKIDTGMGRFGFLPEDVEGILRLYREEKHIAISGIYTHFDCAFNNEARTRAEFAAFQETVQKIRAAGYETGTVHCCNSSAFLRFPEMHCDGVRLGSAILGRVPFHTKLRPVGYAEAHVEELRILPKGHPTGYGAMWTASEDTPVAIVPIGWYNGFRERCDGGITRFRDCLSLILRGLRGIFFRALPLVEVNGHKCRVVGQIGMLHIAVDVRGIECKPGDRVIVPINPLHVKGMKIQYR